MVFVVVVAALLGCGSGDGSAATSATSTVPPKLTVERLPAGPLPGKPVHGIFRGAGLGSSPDVRELIASGSGATRTALLVARGRHDELCLGAAIGARARRGSFRCLRRWDRAPLVFRVGAGGNSLDRTSWVTVVGLARSEVGRVAVESQRGGVRDAQIRSFRDFPWKAFAVAGKRYGHFPITVRALDASSTVIQESDVAGPGTPCVNLRGPTAITNGEPVPRRCRGRRLEHSWSAVGDTIAGKQTGRINRSKQLAIDHPAVLQLVADQSFSIGPVGLWTQCSGGLIGAVVNIRLTKAVTFEGDVPIMRGRPGIRTAYLQGTAHVRASGMLSLMIYIDLHRRTVVGIAFYPADFHDVNGGAQHPTIETTIVDEPKPAGPPDTGNCWSSED
jgi:hypothetical protein